MKNNNKNNNDLFVKRSVSIDSKMSNDILNNNYALDISNLNLNNNNINNNSNNNFNKSFNNSFHNNNIDNNQNNYNNRISFSSQISKDHHSIYRDSFASTDTPRTKSDFSVTENNINNDDNNNNNNNNSIILNNTKKSLFNSKSWFFFNVKKKKTIQDANEKNHIEIKTKYSLRESF
jgi:hypothetical protein